MGLHVGATSVGDRLCLSLVSDREQIPDLADLAARMVHEFEILEKAKP
jgi:hypothetical protein